MAETLMDQIFEKIVETIREPLLVLDSDLKVIVANRSLYESFKVKPEETVGQLIYDLGNKQWDIPKLRELLETILPEKTSFDNYEVEHDFATIGKRTMLLNARQIERGVGEKRVILLVIEDITERKRLEELLAESEERYRRLFETAEDGILLLEKSKLKIRHANPAIKMMLGYSEKELIGNDMKNIGIPDNIGTFQEILQTLNKDGIAHFEDVAVQNKAGKTIYTDIYMADRALLVQCNIRDITERKISEEMLRESEDKLRKILESNPDPIVVYDNMGYPQYLNSAFTKIFGWSLDELQGRLIPFVPEDQVEITQSKLKGIYESGNSVRFETKRLSKQGKILDVLISAAIIKDLHSIQNGLIVNLRDITDTKKMEAEFRQAQKMESVGRLAGGVAHDYNNALSVIMGFTQLAMNEVDPTAPLHADLEEVLKAANRAASITRQLLAFARKQIIAPIVFDLNKNAKSMLKMLQRLIGEDISLVWLPGADLWSVKMDPSQLDQILANLCVNARDAIAEVGKLTIETDMVTFDTAYCADHHGFIPGEFVMLSVSDNGCGMDKEILANIFEPFFTTKSPDKGTGLGLSTVYGIMKQNNGFINVYSEPGAGTTIKIYLPRYVGHAIGIRKESKEEIPPGFGETVLVVEDEPSILKLARRILEELDYIVLTAKNPKEAIELVEEHTGGIHLLLTDVIMPGMNGLELANRLQSLCPDLKHIFMSGYTSDAIAHHGILDEGVLFMQKPFSKEDLAKIVRKALDEQKKLS
ncbi:MAG: PAS domain S-box protein [Proteobacteria bacterium]|nr:PAS domain S-box protein [Pseudomonadota bacterium]MBU1585159.1 PAS domain S-box protein [Pseudomonadota bacterium]MBU2454472.1 PAS domain S-box protein [Pseudomonadota bacterium]MBU2629049.1 PAS domain S-box protein [Pseudomonadota bacterium]